MHEGLLNPSDAVFAAQGSAQSNDLLKYGFNGLGKGVVPFLFGEVPFENVDVQIPITGVSIADAFKSEVGPCDLTAESNSGKCPLGTTVSSSL